MIGIAAASEGVDVDNLVFVASPGVGVASVDALGVDEDNVWGTRNDKDVIEYGMIHGGDPASERFGGNVFHSEATDAGMNDNHGTYWDKENIKARNLMGDVTTGNLETD